MVGWPEDAGPALVIKTTSGWENPQIFWVPQPSAHRPWVVNKRATKPKGNSLLRLRVQPHSAHLQQSKPKTPPNTNLHFPKDSSFCLGSGGLDLGSDLTEAVLAFGFARTLHCPGDSPGRPGWDSPLLDGRRRISSRERLCLASTLACVGVLRLVAVFLETPLQAV